MYKQWLSQPDTFFFLTLPPLNMYKQWLSQPETFIFWNFASPKHVFINNQNLNRMSYGVLWQMGVDAN